MVSYHTVLQHVMQNHWGMHASLQIFAAHVGVVLRFVLGPLMRSAPAQGSHSPDQKAGQVWGHVSQHIKLRIQALKVPPPFPPFLPYFLASLPALKWHPPSV